MNIFKIVYTLVTWLIITALVAVNVTEGKLFEVIAVMANALAIFAILLSLISLRKSKK